MKKIGTADGDCNAASKRLGPASALFAFHAAGSGRPDQGKANSWRMSKCPGGWANARGYCLFSAVRVATGRLAA